MINLDFDILRSSDTGKKNGTVHRYL